MTGNSPLPERVLGRFSGTMYVRVLVASFYAAAIGRSGVARIHTAQLSALHYWYLAGIIVVSVACLTFSARAPFLTLAGCTLASAALEVTHFTREPFVGSALILVATFRNARIQEASLRLVGVIGAVLATAWYCRVDGLSSTSSGPPSREWVIITIVTLIASSILGTELRFRDLAAVALDRQHEERVELERIGARTVERLRIAQDLHDVVANAMSVIALHAGTARMLIRKRPDGAETALHAIESTSRSALDELRALLSVLRERDTTLPDDALKSTGALLEPLRLQGVCVALDVSGLERYKVTAGQQAACYRIIQECVTNMMKHAAATAVEVSVNVTLTHVLLVVSNDGPHKGTSGHQTGHGIVGIAERARVYNGRLEVDNTPPGFIVRVTMQRMH